MIEFALEPAASENGFDIETVTRLDGVSSCRAEQGVFVVAASELPVALPALLRTLEDQQQSLASLTTRQSSLDDVFLSLTGRHLLDDD